MTPLGLMESPPGNAPLTMVQEYGATPPVAVTVCEYGTVISPSGNEEVVIASGATANEMLSAAVAVRPPASVTCTLKWYVPAPLGVPLITPVDESESPGGKAAVPPMTTHVYGDTPPPCSKDCE